MYYELITILESLGIYEGSTYGYLFGEFIVTILCYFIFLVPFIVVFGILRRFLK